MILSSGNDPKLNKTMMIPVVLVALIIVGVVVFRVLSTDEDKPAPSISVTSTADTPPWYVTEHPEDGYPVQTDPSGTVSTAPPVTEASKPDTTGPSGPVTTDPSDPAVPKPPELPEDPEDPKLSCDKIAQFSGIFIEDGSDAPVDNVVALLVTNHSEKFLDLANVVYEIDGKKATFIVTGLPAGSSTWVMEYSKMEISSDSVITYLGCTTSFREDVIHTTEDVTIKCDGSLLYATNNTDRTLENVFIYYKSLHSDGNYFGGITYMVEFGSIEPGETVEELGGHFSVDESEIVRIGWQESQSDGTS